MNSSNGFKSQTVFIVFFWAKNIVSITIHTPLSPMNICIRIIENENQLCNNSVHRQSIRYVNYLGTEKLVRVL